MSFSPVLEKLETLAKTPSTNDKVALLKDYLEDDTFLKVVKYTLSGDRMFHIKKLPDFKPSFSKGNVDSVFSFLKRLSKQTGTSDAEKNKLNSLASIDKASWEVVYRIVNKDLKCGVSGKLVNKARSATVNLVPYCRCSTQKKIENIVYPAIIQEKADGMYVNVMINKKGQIKIITRNGKTVWKLKKLKNILRKAFLKKKEFSNIVLMGELLVRKNKKILPRKTGNGILNSAIHGTITKQDSECVIFHCWDLVSLQDFYNGHDKTPYIKRLSKIKKFIKAVHSEDVDLVLTKIVNSYKEARVFYKKIRKDGGEGAVLKNESVEWKDHTSTNQIKMKNVSEAELLVTGYSNGKKGTKYEGMLGSLSCESACGKLKVSVGSGFSDKEREDPIIFLGKIISVEFESVIKDKKKEEYSLFLPIYSEIRHDRNKADTLEDILKR